MTNLITLHSVPVPIYYWNWNREGSLRMLGWDTQMTQLHNKNFAIFDIKLNDLKTCGEFLTIWFICRETYMYGGDLSGPSSNLRKENGILIRFILSSSKLFWNNSSNLHITNTYCTSKCIVRMVNLPNYMISFHDTTLQIHHETWYMFHSLS
jgi:hypothetical protein